MEVMLVKRGAKRFYTTVYVGETDEGYAVRLDGKPIKTPGGNEFSVPTLELGEAIADEWRGQGAEIDPDTMPLTRYANTVIDRVSARHAAIAADLAKFAAHDLLCYREDVTTELMQRQAAAWDPWIAWVADRHGVELEVARGLTPIEQPAETLERIAAAIAAYDAHRLAVLHTAITITGSAVLGLAFVARALDAAQAFAAARVDEAYQAERWGRDEEAEARDARRLADLKAAERYLSLLPAV
jgi:chaperone required for assembly of F1-ATPase